MKVSRKSDYTLRVLCTLVENYGGEAISIRTLAEKNDVPKRFLEHLMLESKAKGWVRSVSGRFGGYVLGKKPEDITMDEVLRHFDGVLAPVGCVSVEKYQPCTQESRCRFRRVLLEIRNLTVGIMKSTTLASICAEGPAHSEKNG